MRWVRLIEVGRVICFVYLGLGPSEMRTQRRKLLVWWELWEVGDRLRVMRGGWLLKLKYREERREIIAGRVRVMRGGWVQYNFWGESLGWVLRHEGEHREERRDEMRVQRRKLLVGWELWEVGDRLRVMRWVTSKTQVQRREERNYCWSGESYERWMSSIFLGWEFRVSSETWGRAQRREERWDD